MTYIIYFFFVVADLNSAKGILKNFHTYEDSNGTSGDRPTIWDYLFVTHVRFAEIGNIPLSIVLYIFEYNLWDNDHLPVLLFIHWLTLGKIIPAGIIAALILPVTLLCMLITYSYGLPTY